MKKHIVIKIVAVLALVISLVGLQTPMFASADTPEQAVCGGISGTYKGTTCTTSSGPSVNSLLTAVINVMSLLVGIVSVIMIIFGGFKYITSAGDAGKISSAKSTIIYALVGLVLVAFAQAIVLFVLQSANQK